MPGLVKAAEFVAKLSRPTFAGPSRVDWTKKAWVEDHAAYYIPVFRLDKSLPIATEIVVDVKEDDSFGRDDLLGQFFVRFPAHQTQGVVRTVNNSLAQSRGFPPITNGKFWLVVSSEGRLRGNKGHEDDGHANVYIEAYGKIFSHGKIDRYVAIIVPTRQSTRKSIQRRRV